MTVWVDRDRSLRIVATTFPSVTASASSPTPLSLNSKARSMPSTPGASPLAEEADGPRDAADAREGEVGESDGVDVHAASANDTDAATLKTRVLFIPPHSPNPA